METREYSIDSCDFSFILIYHENQNPTDHTDKKALTDFYLGHPPIYKITRAFGPSKCQELHTCIKPE